MHIEIFFTADYNSIMQSLVFNVSLMFDRQCVNITILDDDLIESLFFNPPEVFQVLLRVPEPNDAVQLGVQTAFVSIEDDDCRLINKCVWVKFLRVITEAVDVCRLKNV